jgi:hypothetical protein
MTKPRLSPPSSLKDQLEKFQETLFGRQKYVKNEFQAYGLELAKELHDWKNRSLYIRLAKQVNRELLETARHFVKDQTTGTIKTPARLFMWKLKELRTPSTDTTK